jgi:hypothetical protein
VDVELVLSCASAAPDGAVRNAALLLMAVLGQVAPKDVLEHVLRVCVCVLGGMSRAPCLLSCCASVHLWSCMVGFSRLVYHTVSMVHSYVSGWAFWCVLVLMHVVRCCTQRQSWGLSRGLYSYPLSQFLITMLSQFIVTMRLSAPALALLNHHQLHGCFVWLSIPICVYSTVQS